MRSYPGILAVLAMGLGLVANPACAQKRTSTAEERTRAVELTKKLEQDPFYKEARQDHAWLAVLFDEITDVNVKVCPSFLGPLLGKDKNHGNEIFFHALFAQGSFMIENPDQAKDDYVIYLKGVEGALRYYEAIRKEKPKVRWALLDTLIVKRDAGQLGDYIREKMAACGGYGTGSGSHMV